MKELMSGLQLMLLGMGTVFVFLTIMILWINFAAWATRAFAHLLPEEPVHAPSPGGGLMPRPGASVREADDADVTAAISAAIHAYRNERKQHKR